MQLCTKLPSHVRSMGADFGVRCMAMQYYCTHLLCLQSRQCLWHQCWCRVCRLTRP